MPAPAGTLINQHQHSTAYAVRHPFSSSTCTVPQAAAAPPAQAQQGASALQYRQRAAAAAARRGSRADERWGSTYPQTPPIGALWTCRPCHLHSSSSTSRNNTSSSTRSDRPSTAPQLRCRLCNIPRHLGINCPVRLCCTLPVSLEPWMPSTSANSSTSDSSRISRRWLSRSQRLMPLLLLLLLAVAAPPLTAVVAGWALPAAHGAA